MNDEKIKPVLNGAAETMLQSFYARALYSKNPKNKFKDEKAEEIVAKLDYDFGNAEKDSAMSGGVVARTLVFDELVDDFIKKYPDCTVVNIACGLDTRFYRMDNGKITWYNIDLPETIEVRDSVYHESGRISTIGCSAFEPEWAEKVKVRGKMLFIIEGLTMYLTAEQVKKMLGIIRDNFDNAYVMMECISTKFINKENIEKSIKSTGATFIWGANSFDDLGDIGKGFKKVKDDNILRGMPIVSPVFKLITWMPVVKRIAERILIFEKI
jgi:O-methyltransferase involved in polyketide biosynthesis